jgi:hypothetical protein
MRPAETGPTFRAGVSSEVEGKVNLETPQSALESLEQAAFERDWDSFAACIAPKYAGSYTHMIAGLEPVFAASDRLLAAAEKRFGAADVAPLRQGLAMISVDSPLECVCSGGKVDWSQVKVTVDGDSAKIEVDDYPMAVVDRIDGKWFVTPHTVAGQEPAALDAEMTEKAAAQQEMAQAILGMAEKVEGGELTLEELLSQL